MIGAGFEAGGAQILLPSPAESKRFEIDESIMALIDGMIVPEENKSCL